MHADVAVWCARRGMKQASWPAPSAAAIVGTSRNSWIWVRVPIARRPSSYAMPIGPSNCRKCVLTAPPARRAITTLPVWYVDATSDPPI